MATSQTNYGTATAVTVTLTSLTDTSSRQSTEIDNGTTAALDYMVRVKTNGQAGGTGPLHVYVAAQLGDDIRAGGVGASDAAFSGQVDELKWLDTVPMNATTSVTFVTRPISAAFGGRCPEKFVLVFENQSGATLSATGADHDVDVQAIKVDTA